jgi:hypothetical protein
MDTDEKPTAQHLLHNPLWKQAPFSAAQNL